MGSNSYSTRALDTGQPILLSVLKFSQTECCRLTWPQRVKIMTQKCLRLNISTTVRVTGMVSIANHYIASPLVTWPMTLWIQMVTV